MAAYTYADGPKVILNRDFSTHDAFRLCDYLRESFGPGFVFGPEPISEGGILMIDWPGKKTGEYKTFRIPAPSGRWPIISKDTLEQWRHSPPEAIFHSGGPTERTCVDLFLKAFHGAPCWTTEELLKVRIAFERLGFQTRDGKTKCGKLVQHGELGLPQ